MCLITNKKPKIATSDIVVYKAFLENIENPVSVFLKFHYKPNILYQTEIKQEQNIYSASPCSEYDERYLEKTFGDYTHLIAKRKLQAYNEGFHSGFIKEIIEVISPNVWECIIPKGSEYIEDFVGYVISNQIIIKHKL